MTDTALSRGSGVATGRIGGVGAIPGGAQLYVRGEALCLWCMRAASHGILQDIVVFHFILEGQPHSKRFDGIDSESESSRTRSDVWIRI